MNLKLLARASKSLVRLSEPTKSRISAAIENLRKEPPRGDIKHLRGRDGYRVRVGDYRILFDIRSGEIIITDIGVRGQIYKWRN